MNRHNLTESNQAKMAKEMNESLAGIKNAHPGDYPKQLGEIKAMLIYWLINMGELKNE